MTPEELKAVRDRLEGGASWDDITWRTQDWRETGRPMQIVGEAPYGVENAHGVVNFVTVAAHDVAALLSHADAMQARLDAALAERDQLRAIFSQDYLPENEAARLAYERGRADLLREQDEKWKAGGFPVPDHIAKGLREFFRQGQRRADPSYDDYDDDDAPGDPVPLPDGVNVESVEVLRDGTDDLRGYVRDAVMRAMGLPAGLVNPAPDSKPGHLALCDIAGDAVDIGAIVDALAFQPITLEAKTLPTLIRVPDEFRGRLP